MDHLPVGRAAFGLPEIPVFDRPGCPGLATCAGGGFARPPAVSVQQAPYPAVPPVRFRRLPDVGDLPLPRYETAGAAGMDLRAVVRSGFDFVEIAPGDSAAFGTGFEIAVPAGYEGQVRGRSGLAFRHGIAILHGVGTVDCDFRGEVQVILVNHGRKPFRVYRGDRIAQLVVSPVRQHPILEVRELDTTERGQAGYGSTGGFGGIGSA